MPITPAELDDLANELHVRIFPSILCVSHRLDIRLTVPCQRAHV